MTTFTVKAVLGRQRDAKPARRAGLRSEGPTLPLAENVASDTPVSRTARLLALGYKVRRLLDSGALPDQRESAARLGIVFPQLTHILNLTYLSPEVQERILAGTFVVSEHAIRTTCRIASWSDQQAELDRGTPR